MNNKLKFAAFIIFTLILTACGTAATPTLVPIIIPGNTVVPGQGQQAPTVVVPTQAANAAVSGGCANTYFPVPSGANWAYSSTGGALGAFTYTWTVAAVSDTGFTTDIQSSLGANSTVKWNCQDGNLAALDGGSGSLSITTSKVTVTSDSITADGYNIPASFDTGNTWSEKVTTDSTVKSGTKTEQSQLVSQLDCTAAGTDTVTVPSGTFETVKVTCNETIAVSALVQGTAIPAGNPVAETITDWYAKGVGLVKSVKTVTSTGSSETIVLTQYKV